ncbi:MAG: NUDIX hydrolase [Anaerolineae bacterium]|jgi:ADP-ribose pyrophosphatase|nr:NUDIX hydrolase [Anaerolineae bacterium]
MDHLKETVLSSEAVYEGKLVKLYVDQVRLPDGKTSMREVVRHPGAVAMVPLLDNGDVVMVRQFRLPAGRVLLEIPAGGLDPDEDPAAAAVRELQEEIGYRPGTLTAIGGEYTAPGYTTEFIHFYLATGLEPSNLDEDADEFLEVVRLPLDEALRQIDTGVIQDGKTIAALLLVARRLGR